MTILKRVDLEDPKQITATKRFIADLDHEMFIQYNSEDTIPNRTLGQYVRPDDMYIRKDDDYWFIYCNDTQYPIGLISVVPQPIYHMLYISNLYIMKAFRGRGVGSNVIRDIIQQYKQEDAEYNIAEIGCKVNSPAERLYKKMGFVPYHQSMTMRI